jgi:hypothetical protein
MEKRLPRKKGKKRKKRKKSKLISNWYRKIPSTPSADYFNPILLILTILLLLHCQNSLAEPPFEAEKVGVKPEQELRINWGLDYSHIDSSRDLLAFPAIGFNYAAGPIVDLQADYDFLYRFTKRGTTIYGSGDLTLWTKVRFLPEKGYAPGVGLRFGVKLPNANAQDGLGTDQTDFYASILASQKLGRFENRLNLGLAILDDPLKLRGQQDMLTLALATIYNLSPGWQVLVDFYSQQGANAKYRFSKISAGARYLNGKWAWDAALKKGLRSDHKGYQDELSLDWGIVLGVSRYFDLSRN